MKIPTLIRGVLYESMAEAARSLAVAPATIWAAAERGALDRVGMRGRSVTVRGVEYRSMSEASRELGVNHATVRAAVARGTQDNIGLRKYG